jgi:hypothetical protein
VFDVGKQELCKSDPSRWSSVLALARSRHGEPAARFFTPAATTSRDVSPEAPYNQQTARSTDRHQFRRQPSPKHSPILSAKAPAPSSSASCPTILFASRFKASILHAPLRRLLHRASLNRTRPTRLYISFLAYKHTTNAIGELFPPRCCPPCLCLSKSLTPQSAPSTRVVARLYVLSGISDDDLWENTADMTALTAKTSSSYTEPGRLPICSAFR